MEKSTKTILWILAFITLPITIPLTIISVGMLATAFLLILGIVSIYPFETIIVTAVFLIIFGLNSYFPPKNTNK